jgi:thymidylate synthase
MLVITARNVHTALPIGVRLLHDHSAKRGSRNGLVYVANAPVTTTYLRPQERVLFQPERDAHPFFHLMEALWMLKGRDDTQFVGGIVKRMYEFSDDGKKLHGAYGKRWRHWFQTRVDGSLPRSNERIDQLDIIVKRLRKHPDDRRCVLQMWDVERDLDQPLKDVPCNTAAYLTVNNEGALDLTVTNRSNDMVWGAYGANAVQFSMLQEYLARRIGVPIGRYFQVSNNFHAYLDTYAQVGNMQACPDPYASGEVEPYPLMDEGKEEQFDADLITFFVAVARADDMRQLYWHNSFFPNVAVPMWRALQAYKAGHFRERYLNAQAILNDVKATDWKRASQEWITRREQAYIRKASGQNAGPKALGEESAA